MRTDGEIRDDVIDELGWDPQITNSDAIGVGVKGGAVTLTGNVPTRGDKLHAALAAERVYGVEAVASELEVTLGGVPCDDHEIARVLGNHVQVPRQRTRPGTERLA